MNQSPGTEAADIQQTQTEPSRASASRLPQIRPVTFDDLKAALRDGWNDFTKAPLMGLFFGAVYAGGGIALLAAAVRFEMGWIVYPAMTGFALIGPFAAVGLYEISRQLEKGERPRWGAVLSVIWAQRRREIAWMGFAMLFILIMWMYQVRILVALFFGLEPFYGIEGLVRVLFTTNAGFAFLALGHVIGAFLSMVVFAITVMSIPLLLDRDIDFVTAMITSVKSVKDNAAPMLGWGAFVVVVLFVSSLPVFLGLLITLPVLGHATWRLYRRVIVAEGAEAGA